MNTWVVNFGPMLEATLSSADARAAFVSLTPGQGENCRWRSEYDLVYYEFIDNRAKVRLRIRTTGPGGKSAEQEYYAEGPEQLGKMYWGSAFAMKNAVQQSTKGALDTILISYFADLGRMAAAK